MIEPSLPTIMQGDFNLDSESLADLLPGLLNKALPEIVQAEPTNHYPLITVFRVDYSQIIRKVETAGIARRCQ
jgi:hypothetical protein